MTPPLSPGEFTRQRWTRADGSRLLLSTRGRLLEARGAAGAYRLVQAACTLPEALAYGEAHGWRRRGAAAGSDEPKPSRRQYVRPPPAVKPQPKMAVLIQADPAAWDEREARLLDLAATVQADLARIGHDRAGKFCQCGKRLRAGCEDEACAACRRGT